MIFDISDTGGLIRLGPFAILWQNPDSEYPGFTTFSWNDTSLEFGDIDNGNGVYLTGFRDGEIEYSRKLLQLS